MEEEGVSTGAASTGVAASTEAEGSTEAADAARER
jgi:hypothetical protein